MAVSIVVRVNSKSAAGLDPAWLLQKQLEAGSFPEFALEHKFHPTRKWKFDFAFISQKIAIEVEGGSWVGGRHTRGAGYARDCEKYNHAQLLGWQVYRFTSDQVRAGAALTFLEKVFKAGHVG